VLGLLIIGDYLREIEAFSRRLELEVWLQFPGAINAGNRAKIVAHLLVTLGVYSLINPYLPSLDLSADELNTEDTITWYTFDSPPVTITVGKDTDRGFGDRNRLLFQQALTQYTHLTKTVNYQRALLDMKNGEKVCSSALLKTVERKKYITYSHPNFLLIPNGVLVRSADIHLFQPYIDSSNRLNLSLALTSNNFILGTSSGRRYGAGVDSLLEKIRKNSPGQLLIRSGQDVNSGLIHMLHKNRLDLVLGFSTEQEYAARSIGNEAATAFLPIVEQLPYTLGYTGCSKGEWGDRMVGQINGVLEEPATFVAFMQYYKNWLPSSNHSYYDELVSEALLNNPEMEFRNKRNQKTPSVDRSPDN